MKMMIISVALLGVLSTHAQGATNEFIWTVGTETNGSPIQQIEWLFRDDGLSVTNCPIWAGTPLTILEEESDRVKVRCDKQAVPQGDKWSHAILKGNIVVGWLPRHVLVKIRISDWNTSRGNAQPTSGGDSSPRADAGLGTPQK